MILDCLSLYFFGLDDCFSLFSFLSFLYVHKQGIWRGVLGETETGIP